MKRYLPFFYPGLTQKSLVGVSAFVRLLTALALCLPLQTSLSYAQFSGSGSGTEGEPFQITTATHLNEIRNNLSAHYILLNDIDLTFDTSDPAGLFWNGGLGWEPVGEYILDPSNYDPFIGKLDGGGFKISGLNINRPTADYVGLFGLTDGATIINLGILGADITGKNNIGTLIGYAIATTVSNCFITGEVTGVSQVGGFIGFVLQVSNISQCFTNVVVTGTGSQTGGFAGYIDTGTVLNSYATGSVTGVSEVGGFAGKIYTYDGGGSIASCYSSSAVSGSSDVGGFAGRDEGTETSAAYWSTATSGQATSGSGTGLNSTDIRKEASFSGWDFVSTWEIVENSSYPFLQNTLESPAPGITIATCGADFTDSGGIGGDYQSSENYNRTFKPTTAGAKVAVSFTMLNLEADKDKLEVFDGPFTSSTLLTTLSGTTVPDNITATSPGGELTFRFTSDASAQFGGWTANISCVVEATATPEKPAQPTFGTVTENSIVVNWVAPDANGSPITSYMLEQRTANVSYSSVYTGPNLTFTASNLQLGKEYFYRVTATNAVGMSEPSDETSTTTLTTVPGPATNVAAEALSHSTIKVTWGSPTQSGGLVLTGYKLIYRKAGTSTFQFVEYGIEHSRTLTNLEINTTYEIQVIWRNSKGESTYGELVTATTLKRSQRITFNGIPNQKYLTGKLDIKSYASSESTLPVSFEVVSGPATIDNNLIEFTGAGKVVVKATQEGNSTFYAAQPVEREILVQKANQTVAFAPVSPIFGTGPVPIQATASSSLPVAISLLSGAALFDQTTNMLTPNAAGDIVLVGKQPGNDNFNRASDVQFTVSVSKGTQIISFTGISDFAPNEIITYNPAGFELNATSNSDTPITYQIDNGEGTIEGNIFKPSTVDSFTITASQPETGNWKEAVSRSVTLFLIKAQQEVAVGSVGSKLKTDQPFTISATASAGGNITAISGTGLTTIEGLTVTINPAMAAGKETISVTAQETDLYHSMTTDIEFCISPAPPTISVGQTLDGNVALVSNNGVESHQWILDGEVVGTTEAAQGLPISQTGVYSAIALANGGCPSSAASNELAVTEAVINGLTHQLEGLSVFPNPASESLNISVDNGMSGEVNIAIHSIDGRLMYTGSAKKNSSDFHFNIDTSALKNGVYFISINMGQRISVRKIVKRQKG
ncbi:MULTISPECIES: fibronectin type III domain-containing protein [unclassified Imperialibacter]|uniref:fibronectin type III domain-containing protein n=1 Tax=unclassified Imperialibacter TaxID=2629706 RepID=UPI00125AEF85|nr:MULTISPECIES: fibronectin type III domain-containing protein [unclassified Imperialibacter]CAD5247936.1 hypothetical protein IMPERIA75_10213 [Imperialibacter sp. 75]CAD5248057.1 hypothetical protein IMPERIA89_10214 [Imperialibacter sp. 89]VVS97311.1 hypothetical protein IMPR6_10214 [Imperialibacter sp. EC-SDR9]